MEVYDIQYIKISNANHGFHFFSASAMRGFKTRVSPKVYQGVGGIYFVTSEALGNGPRLYTVRQFEPSTGRVKTISDFWQVSKSYANRSAKRLSEAKIISNCP